MLTVLFHLYSLRWTVPCFVMMGATPIYMTIWSFLRTLTAPLPQRIYRIGDDVMFSQYMRLLLFFFHTYVNPKVYGYGNIKALLEKEENVIYLSNHQCTVDWIVATMLSEQRQCTGTVRYIMKNGLKLLPIYGFYCYQHSCAFVGRSGKFRKEKLDKHLQYIRSKDIPIWLVIFPEGTRFNPDLPEVIEKSKQFAKDSGYSELHQVLTRRAQVFKSSLQQLHRYVTAVELHQVLTPRAQAFKSSLQQLRGYVTAVYDVTIAYSNTFNTETRERTASYGMPDFLMGKSPEIHLKLDRIDVNDIPEDEVKLNDWLYNQFEKKDRLLSEFYNPDSENFGKFPGQRCILEVKKRRTLPPFLFYSVSLAALMSTSETRKLYMKIGLLISVSGIIWVSIRS